MSRATKREQIKIAVVCPSKEQVPSPTQKGKKKKTKILTNYPKKSQFIYPDSLILL